MAVIFFTQSTWGGTDSLVSLGTFTTDWFGQADYYSVTTLDRAVELASDGDIVALMPPITDDSGNERSSFFDSNGYALQRVEVKMESILQITKALTIAGGAYRLRLSGEGAYYLRTNAACSFVDVDFVKMTGDSRKGAILLNTGATFTRCLFAGLRSLSSDSRFLGVVSALPTARHTFNDCAFVANRPVDGETLDLTLGANGYLNRCVGRFSAHSANMVDCVNLNGLDDYSSVGFVAAPKILDDENAGYYTDGTAWTNSDWGSVDLRLVASSSSATGNSLTSEDGDVYDLAGNKRKAGGALGAFEVFSDVTRWRVGGAWYSDAAGTTAAAVPTESDVCYFDENEKTFTLTCCPKKAYYAGWTRVLTNWGGRTSVVGLNAEGNVTPVWFFYGTGWNITASAQDLGIVETELFGTRRVMRIETVDKALALCSDGAIITPQPPMNDASGNPLCTFTDAGGFLLSRVDVTMGSNLIINKEVTFCGGAYRLRLDGNGAYSIQFKCVAQCDDCDFVRIKSLYTPLYGSLTYMFTARRCFFGGNENHTVGYGSSGATFYDSAWAANKYNSYGYDLSDQKTYCYRCTLHHPVGWANQRYYDCIDVAGDQTAVNAIGFVSPPKVYDTSNPGYYTDGTTWTNTLWESVDLRLQEKPTWTETRDTEDGDVAGTTTENVTINGKTVVKTTVTTLNATAGTTTLKYTLSYNAYATGGTSVTSGATVYDLDGLPRKVGGALGAYEVYAATHYARSGVLYAKIEYDGDDAPRISVTRSNVLSLSTYAYTTYGESASGYYYYQSKGLSATEWGTGATGTSRFTNCPAGYVKRLAFCTADGTITSSFARLYLQTSPGEGYTPVDTFGGYCFLNAAASALSYGINSSSVLYLGYNKEYADDSKTVSQIIVPGRRHVELGNNGGGAELILGLGASAVSSGKLTLKGQTQTDAELWRRLTLESGADLTLDDCATRDSDA